MKARDYQAAACDKTIEYMSSGKGENPIVVLPTGSGKTIVIIGLIKALIKRHGRQKILVVSHVQEILKQNHKALTSEFGRSEVGLYSAGLKTRVHDRDITVCGIQSIFNMREFKNAAFVIIDECHTIPHSGEGRYRKFLTDIAKDARRIGLTATPYRLKSGYLHLGKGALFDGIAFNLSTMEGYKWLVDEGYMSKMILKSTSLKLSVNGVRTTAGDFNQGDLSSKFDRMEITKGIISEIIKLGKNYKKWLLFAIDISHAEHIHEELTKHGIRTACIHSKMKADREKLIDEVRLGAYRAVVNVDVLTTGFDVPDIDLIAMIRPTKSPVLYVQTVGRGARVAYKYEHECHDAYGNDLTTKEGRLKAIVRSNKAHCLVLDFAGNVSRLGPIDSVRVKEKKKKGNAGEQVIKTCPKCGVMHHPAVRVCDCCNHKFEFKHGLTECAASGSLLSSNADSTAKGEEEAWLAVMNTSYSIHSKAKKPDSLRVTYKTGLSSFSEYICIGHQGFAYRLASHWVKKRYSGKFVNSAHDLLAKSKNFKVPKMIKVRRSGKYFDISGYKF